MTLSDAIGFFVKRPHGIGSRGVQTVRNSSIGKLKVSSLSRTVIRRWCEERLKSVKLSTVQNDLRLIRLSIELARCELGVKLKDNPAVGINLNDPSRRLTDDEATRLYAALEGRPMLRALVIVAVETGLRRGAVSALQWRDVDLEQSVLHIRQRADGPVVQSLPLSPIAADALRTVPRRGYRIFVMPVDRLQWVWATTLRRAGLHGFKFWEPQHVLRRESQS
ncbi:tyrosine-type recombinase/integrase [Sphingomonas mucosissima]